MANPVRGQVPFETGGKAYILSYSTNALCALEAEVDMGITQVAGLIATPETMRLGMVRAVFWAGLLDHHAGMTVDDAGALMTELGMADAIALIGRAFALAFPEVQAGARPLAGKKPARGGTGKVS